MKILVFLLILSILVIIHELGHFLVAKKNNVYVEEFGLGIPPRLFGKKIGETLYSINALPFGGFVKVLGEEEAELSKKKLSPSLYKRTFVSKKPLVKAMIIVAGVVANFLLGWVIISYLFTRGVPVPTNKVIVEKVSSHSPAYDAGMKAHDFITQVIITSNKTIAFPIQKTEDLIALSKKYAGEKITLVIVRDGIEKHISLIPRKNPPPSQGALGVMIQTDFLIKKYPWYSAPFFGLYESVKITKLMVVEIIKILFQLITFQKVSLEVAGPVGIAQIAGKAVDVGFDAVLQLLGILSFNLAIINIFPFPALDGGRLVFVCYEWITKRKVNPSVERKVNFTGFAILISLIILITIKDISRLIIK